ncbi:CHAT domain-containing protein [Mycena epipterygia]|nr:CHAT domain-containing protein [Mycena epipterygia]
METDSPPRSSDSSAAYSLVARADSILRDYIADSESSLTNLNTAIYLLAQTWSTHSPQDSECLNLLATALLTRFSYTGKWKDVQIACMIHGAFDHTFDGFKLDIGISLVETAAAQLTWGHSYRATALSNLGTGLEKRFKIRGSPQDLDKAIDLHREALNLRQAPHPDCDTSLINLGLVLQEWFETRGGAGDLDSAIELHCEALDLCPAPHPHRDISLNNLANGHFARFQTQGDAGDLENAIELHREALDLCPAPHPDRSGSLNNLANVLYTRFRRRADAADLDSAIVLHCEALGLRAAPHPARSSSLTNLASVLYERFRKRGDTGDLDNSIGLIRESLNLHPAPHPNHGRSLSNLAVVLLIRFQAHGDTADLDNAIELNREALDLQAALHPDHGSCLNNLASVFHTRFQIGGDVRDLDNAIELCNEAQVLLQPPHPLRGVTLRHLAIQLTYMYDNFLNRDIMEDAIIAFHESSGYLPSPVYERCEAATTWARHAEQRNHASTLEAYETSVELLPQHAMLGLDIQSHQKALKLKWTIGLATDAAACASRLNKLGKAIELLEAGRSVFWSQALQLHTSLDDLEAVHPELAERIRNISKDLEVGSHRAVASIRMLPAVHKDHMMLDKDDAYYCKLNAKWVEVIDEVHLKPGFQRFLRPKLMNELKAAAINGPIIILNPSRSLCTAFIVTLSEDVQSVDLENMTWGRAQQLVDLLHALLSQNRTVETSENHTPNKVFGWLLRELWILIVQPVFHALELKKSDYPSRLWWCPTGPFTFLPIHAAGLYTPHETDCVSDYVASSYTPTLTTLLDPPTRPASAFKMTAVIQPRTDNCSDLPATVEELEQIKQQVPSQWLTSFGDTTPATVDVALQHLRESSVVHFACHGTQDLQNPLETGLLLTDGRLKVSELMRGKAQRKIMTLAFLSACETAKGDDTVPDDAMHLAATLLSAGFRGVVATMWTMADLDGPKIAETFYQHLFKGCDTYMDPPDLTKAAECLHLAVAKLRANPNVPFTRWVPFVHYGL